MCEDNTPLISIITVTYNSEKFLEQTILSVISQSYCNYEYLLIDGGSTDRTLDIIKKYEKEIDYWTSQRDNGMYDALNKGIEVSSGEIIGQINSDDKYHSDVFSKVAEVYEKQSFDMLYGDTTSIDGEGNKIGYKSAREWQNMYYGNPEFLHSACFFSKNVLEKLDGYSIDYKIASDIDLFQRIHLKSDKIKVVNEPFSFQRIGGMSHKGFGPYLGYWEYRNISIKNGCNSLLATYYFLKKSLLRIVFSIRDYIKINLSSFIYGE